METYFLRQLDALASGKLESGLREPGDPMDGPVAIETDEVEDALKNKDVKARYRGVLLHLIG